MNTFAIASLFAVSTMAAGGAYDYADNGASWGKTKEQFAWFANCQGGKQQSPINLLTTATTTDVAKIDMSGYFNAAINKSQFADTSKSAWKADIYPEDERLNANMSLTYQDGTTGDFTFKQYHFHAPSEHAVDGKLMDAEIHFVHVDKNSGTMTDGLQTGESYGAVIGVFFDQSAGTEDNEFLESFWEATEGDSNVDIESILSAAGSEGFWSYPGSFTTPGCDEGISWSVMKKAQPISDAQLLKFTSKLGNTGNNRVLQAVNDRTVYLSTVAPATGFSAEDGATGVTTYAALVVAAVAALF